MDGEILMLYGEWNSQKAEEMYCFRTPVNSAILNILVDHLNLETFS
jgi:hypothetical protein